MSAPLDELQWKSPEWIQAFGLRTDNVLEYFSESPFYSKTANNQVIRMQRQFAQPPVAPNTLVSDCGDQDHEFDYVDPVRREILAKYPVYAILESELSKMKGIEYVLAYVREPDFWIIKKQERKAPNSVQILQAYYVIGANVYQSPNVFNVIQNRLLSTTLHLSNTFSKVFTLTQFEPSTGVQFKAAKQSSAFQANTSPQFAESVQPTTAAGYTAPATNSVAATQPGSTFETTGTQNTLSRETLDALMLLSMKSAPEYI